MHKKTQQLGMNFSTAQARLKKIVMFNLVCELGKNTCFRCNKLIESALDLSIEHKLPWQDISVDLFWDLDNIAFSHFKCNSGAGRRDKELLIKTLNKHRKNNIINAPEGKAWCYGHKGYMNKDLFNLNKWQPSGVQRYCKDCRSNKIGRISLVGKTAVL